jgi:hypothetical protein
MCSDTVILLLPVVCMYTLPFAYSLAVARTLADFAKTFCEEINVLTQIFPWV